MIEEQPIVKANVQATTCKPLVRLLRYVVRVTAALPVAIVRGIVFCAWYLAYSFLCLLRPVVNVMMLGGLIMPLVAFIAFVKPEAANGMPFWVFLVMAAGFVGFARGYSKFVDWITPPGEPDPAARYRPRDR
ncbi:hypothetical protein GR138_26000 [Shinella kummerowiae]|jgi:hypothetical protein|uniref:Uncharacterized protein n=1 Tax=Shinella kummerowiae TaxID=417745 RepID=A0A6N8SJM9_9HYPH|nr:hypothetical protein [Shinella kummerowiae]MXN48663.1 hypothetical protein [Shinella kummerowiae]